MQVLVRDNNVDRALKVLKKKMQRDGVLCGMKLRGHYEKPREESSGEVGSRPSRPQAGPQKVAARGSAADEAPSNPRDRRKRRSCSHASFLIWKFTTTANTRSGTRSGSFGCGDSC